MSPEAPVSHPASAKELSRDRPKQWLRQGADESADPVTPGRANGLWIRPARQADVGVPPVRPPGGEPGSAPPGWRATRSGLAGGLAGARCAAPPGAGPGRYGPARPEARLP